MSEFLVHTISWDTDSGCGCEVFISSELRDAAFREFLLSHARSVVQGGIFSMGHLREIDLDELVETLDRFNCLDGARFFCGSQYLKMQEEA